MIRRRISLILAILTVMTCMTPGSYVTVFARSGGGLTTDISAPPDDTGVMPQTGPDHEPTLPNTYTREEDAPAKEREESLYTKTIDNGDGTKTLEVYGTPVRYITEDGSVKDISLTPVRDGSGGYRTGDHRLSISFPEKSDSGISLDTGKYVITATPVYENGTAVKTASAYLSDTDAIVYRCDPKTSYEYNITYSGYKENIVVSEYTGQTDFLFLLETDGLKLSGPEEENRSSGLILTDAEGKTVAAVGDIIVFTCDDRNNTFGNISYETVTEGREYLLRISLPAEYLADPATHYPIYIDPTLTVEEYNVTVGSIEDITVNQNHATDSPTSGTLYVGKAGANYGAMRSVMRFPELTLTGILPSSITSAVVHVRDLMCYGYSLQVDCYGYYGTLPTGSFTQTNMTWSGVYSTMQYYESGGAYHTSNSVCYGNGVANSHWYEFSILPAVQSWAQSQNTSSTFQKSQQGIAFKSTDTYEASSNEHYVCFGSYDRASYNPYLIITYIEPQSNSISLNSGSLSLLVGNGYSLSAQTMPTGQTVTWSSTNPAVATVNTSGYVSAKSTGSTVITASAGGVSASCLVAVGSLNGVYRIQNLDIYVTNSSGGYLADISSCPILSSYSYQSRNQLWLIENVSGTSRYILNPLSKTTFDYSGTDIGLTIGGENEIPSVIIFNISNDNQIFSEAQWYITGDEDVGFSIRSYNSGDYSILVRNNSSSGVELEYEENLIDEEDPVDKWIITDVDMQMNSPLVSSISSISVYQDSRLHWLPYISATDTFAAEQRIRFFSSNDSKVSVTESGTVTVAGDCPDNYTAIITAACGIYSTQLTVTAHQYCDFFWNNDYYAEAGRISLDERIIWLEDQDGDLLSCSGTGGVTFSAYSNNSFNHEWILLNSANNIIIQSIGNDLFLSVQSQAQAEGSLISLNQSANTLSQRFRFERLGNGNHYIITTASSGYTCAIAFNSNTGQFYQTNRLNTNDLLTFRIREGGSSKLPSGYYCMGNPFVSTDLNGITNYFYLSEPNYEAYLDFFSRTSDYPRWLLMYKGKGYYSIVDEPGENGLALTYTSGGVNLDIVSGNDNQLWECISNINTDLTYSFKVKGQNKYLMRNDTLGSRSHPVIADSSPASTEANWKMILVTQGDSWYNYGLIADVALIGIEDSTHSNSHITWMAEGMDKLFDKRKNNYPIFYNTVSIRYCYYSGMDSDDYLSLIKNAKLIIHRGHGNIDPDSSILLLTPRNNEGFIGNSCSFSGSSLQTNDLKNCECALFLSCRSGGFSDLDFSTSLVSRAVSCGAKLSIGICGIGNCPEINWFLDEYFEIIDQSGFISSPNYVNAFYTILSNIDYINSLPKSNKINTIFVCEIYEAE